MSLLIYGKSALHRGVQVPCCGNWHYDKETNSVYYQDPFGPVEHRILLEYIRLPEECLAWILYVAGMKNCTYEDVGGFIKILDWKLDIGARWGLQQEVLARLGLTKGEDKSHA